MPGTYERVEPQPGRALPGAGRHSARDGRRRRRRVLRVPRGRRLRGGRADRCAGAAGQLAGREARGTRTPRDPDRGPGLRPGRRLHPDAGGADRLRAGPPAAHPAPRIQPPHRRRHESRRLRRSARRSASSIRSRWASPRRWPSCRCSPAGSSASPSWSRPGRSGSRRPCCMPDALAPRPPRHPAPSPPRGTGRMAAERRPRHGARDLRRVHRRRAEVRLGLRSAGGALLPHGGGRRPGRRASNLGDGGRLRGGISGHRVRRAAHRVRPRHLHRAGRGAGGGHHRQRPVQSGRPAADDAWPRSA